MYICSPKMMFISVSFLVPVPEYSLGAFFLKKELKELWDWKKGVIFAPALGRKVLCLGKKFY